MSFYQQAARLNNEGVESLHSENYQCTVELLGDSIQAMKKGLSKQGANKNESKSQSTSNTINTVELPTFQQQRNSFIFNQAFQLPEDETEVNDSASRNTYMYIAAAAVVFNLALAHHRQYLNKCISGGSDDDQTPKQCLHKAEKIYSMTMKLLETSACQNSRMGLIIKLACINNMSSIRFDSCYEVANEALRSLSYFVSSIDEAAGESNKLFEETKYQALLMNVLLLKAPKVAPAA